MTIWTPDITAHSGPRYIAITDAIADAITRGELLAGDRLPPHRTLAFSLGVTTGTVSRAYGIATQRGLVSGEVGRGTYVCPAGGGKSTLNPLFPETNPGQMNLGVNTCTMPWHAEAYVRTLGELARQPGIGETIAYTATEGQPHHREAITLWLKRRGVETTADNIVLTCGAQQSLAISIAVLSDPGQSVLTEALTFPGFMDALGILGRKAAPVAMDQEGMRPDALDRAARETGAKAAFVVPTIQNPTAGIMSEARRREILAVARARDLILIEDDVYGNLTTDTPPPMHTMDPDRVVFVSSASKCLIPGIRCGWSVVPKRFMSRFVSAAFATAVAPAALQFELLHRWIIDGTADQLVARLRGEIQARQEMAAGILKGYEISTHPTSFHLLLQLPERWTDVAFTEAAAAHNIRITPASVFAAGGAPAPRAVRLSISATRDMESLEGALKTLRDLLEAGPATLQVV